MHIYKYNQDKWLHFQVQLRLPMPYHPCKNVEYILQLKKPSQNKIKEHFSQHHNLLVLGDRTKLFLQHKQIMEKNYLV